LHWTSGSSPIRWSLIGRKQENLTVRRCHNAEQEQAVHGDKNTHHARVAVAKAMQESYVSAVVKTSRGLADPRFYPMARSGVFSHGFHALSTMPAAEQPEKGIFST